MRSDEVRVWWADLDGCGTDRFERLLSPEERSRAAAFRFTRDRSRFAAARGMLRALLGDELGMDPRRIEFAYGERGKPRLARDAGELRFNLSHSNGVAALALCAGREVGIDIEARRDELFSEAIARRYLPARAAMEIQRAGTERSREFFRAWVRQEAYAKARGAGLELMGEDPDPDDWSIIDLESPDGYAAAVAIEGAGPARMSTRRI
jgi:4'-phosphopantetheinyl transferase